MRVYLDYNATAPLRPEVVACVAAASAPGFGNPSSLHAEGRAARALLEESRASIAERLGAASSELVFTSGGTEANRLAIFGVLSARRARGGLPSGAHAVVSVIEHASVRDLYQQLERDEGLSISWIPAGTDGRAQSDDAAGLVRAETLIVSLQHSNNETGVLQPLSPLAAACRKLRVPLHCDAVQSLGKVPIDLRTLGADLVTFSGHKLGGPKGVGALWTRRGTPFKAPHSGGPQEAGLRPGTEALPAVAGFDLALELSERAAPDLAALRDRLWSRISGEIPSAVRNGDPAWVLPNTLNISIPTVSAEMLLIQLDLAGVAASQGAACASGARKSSHVLQGMGLAPERVASAVRLSLGWATTPEEIERAATAFTAAVRAVSAPSRAPVRSP